MKAPHGNSKGKSPYKRMKPSTMNHMKDLCKQMGPVATMEAIDNEA